MCSGLFTYPVAPLTQCYLSSIRRQAAYAQLTVRLLKFSYHSIIRVPVLFALVAPQSLLGCHVRNNTLKKQSFANIERKEKAPVLQYHTKYNELTAARFSVPKGFTLPHPILKMTSFP